MAQTTILRSILIASLALVAVSCTKKSSSLDQPQNSSDIFSNRPIGSVKTVVTLSLSEPALLKAATRTANGLTIPAEAKAKLLAQQAQVEKDLQKISPEIKVLYRYRMVVNGIAVVAESSLLPELAKISGVKESSLTRPMARPLVETVDANGTLEGDVNSVNFIGVDKVRTQLGFSGKGLRIGVIDTGIDYTHKMLGGSGNESDYKSVNPALDSNLFPNAKIAGGYDFVGSDFDGSLPFEINQIPKPDANPLDEAGHGTHVAGTIAGIGDGKNSYTGVAPDAQLFALKVFGKGGATGDFAVVAALDYAADPNQDMNLDDQLDVVNLSLGGGFGQPQTLYDEAVRNLSEGGTFVVASAGNAGAKDFIVGAPSTSTEALSVAATVDGSEYNWKYKAVRLISPNNSNWLVKATDNQISKSLDEIGDVTGEIVDIGLASPPIADAIKAKLAGNVALIARGGTTFVEKLKFARDNGAVGAIISNNAPGAIEMGGEEKVDIPAIAVSMELGQKLREEMKLGAVKIQFKTGEFIMEKDKIDTITEFSSKGPRSEDNLLKPEISAPGKSVLSAKMGSGTLGIRLDGTSMSAPHMSGILGLMKQAHPGLSGAELKAILMNTAKSIATSQNVPYSVTLQGAGRVQTFEAATAKIVITPGGVSLGLIQVDQSRQVSKTIKVRNLTAESLSLQITTQAQKGLTIAAPTSVQLGANETKELQLNFTIADGSDPLHSAELNGQLKFSSNGALVAQVPVLAMQKRLSKLALTGSTRSSSTLDLKLTNSGSSAGLALVFNLLGKDSRKASLEEAQNWRSRTCDLESVGYRILQRFTPQGPKEYLQLAFKVYTPVTTWNLCQLSMLIDSDGDGVAEQELASVGSGTIKGGGASYGAVLLDAAKARDIRLTYESKVKEGLKVEMDFAPAVVAGERMAPFEQSTLALMEVEITQVKPGKDGLLHVKFASQNPNADSVEADDYLGAGLGDWLTVSPKAADQTVTDAKEVYGLQPAKTEAVPLTLGKGTSEVVIFYPSNDLSLRNGDQDFGSEIVP